LNPPNDFAIANYLYQPSYISLESALSFYGIITGFPYKITSISTKKSRLFNTDQKEFQYSQIAADLFWGYEKRENFLLADKEKALLDYLYFFSKGIKSFDREEFDLQEINQKKLISYARSFKIAKWLTIIKEYL
jgi:predicted transcriptional regulator of viral defense system